MKAIKNFITKIFFGNRFVLGLNAIGKNSKIGLFHNILNGKYISIGDNTAIGRFSKLHCYDRFSGEVYYPDVYIGNHCTFGQNFTIWCADRLIIEDWVTVAGYCTIANENHGINMDNPKGYRNQPLMTKPVIIKEGTWIGERCCILPGVVIGRKCVIGAGSVVTKSIPDYSLAVGNPARIIKQWSFESKEWVDISYDGEQNSK